MVVKTVRVLNRAGVHARPAALIVQAASRFDSKIMLVR
ncbi:HPr family phosphocarrier protein, partial [Treponema pallidum]